MQTITTMEKSIDELDKQILRMYTQGFMAKDIAPVIFRSFRTVQGKTEQLKKHYNAKTITHLIWILKDEL